MADFDINITDDFEWPDGTKPDRPRLTEIVEYVLKSERAPGGTVSLAIIGDEAICRLKKKYFGTAAVTDVISFDLRDKSDEPLDCEVVVNAQRARQVAQQSGIDWLAELSLYVVHGLLHQLGYNDKTQQDSQRMHLREDKLLSELGFGKVFGESRE